MTVHSPIPWRPLTRHDLDHVRTTVEDVVGQWSSAWIPIPFKSHVDAQFSNASTSPVLERDYTSWSIGPYIRIAIVRASGDAFVNAALDMPGSMAVPPDTMVSEVLDVLREDMIRDLLHLLSQAVGAGESVSPLVAQDISLVDDWLQGGISARCSLPHHKPWIEVFFAAPGLWSSGEAKSSRQKTSGMSLLPRTAAIEDSRITIAAILSRCELSAMELTELSVGDVIATAHPVAVPIDIAVMTPHGFQKKIAQGSPGRIGNKVSLLLTSIQDEHAP